MTKTVTVATTEPGEKPYTVKSGQTFAERISELTGISVITVRRHLSARFKGASGPNNLADRLVRSRQVMVPEVVAEPLRALAWTSILLRQSLPHDRLTGPFRSPSSTILIVDLAVMPRKRQTRLLSEWCSYRSQGSVIPRTAATTRVDRILRR